MPAQVKCPVCASPVTWTAASRWRPFCSERCKLIDLGDWASDRHVIDGGEIVSDEGVGSSESDADNSRH